jgi:hydroxypyruvate reductase
MIDRAICEAVFAEAVAACDPAARVRDALARPDLAVRLVGRELVGMAIGKAAREMARGAGPVARGVAVSAVDDGEPLPAGWRAMLAAHPIPDGRSVAAAAAIDQLVGSVPPDGAVLALVSGGASALVEQPAPGVTLDELRAVTSAVMARGASIGELNVVRSALSWVKAGRLALRSPAPVTTLVASDVIGDDLAVIGSGPTIGPWLDASAAPVDLAALRAAERARAAAVLARFAVVLPDSVRALLEATVFPEVVAREDRAVVVAPMRGFAEACAAALARRGVTARLVDEPIEGEIGAVVERLAAKSGVVVAWGEPTVVVPAVHGEGGRAQQLALALARRLRGGSRAAFVAGSDGADGPAPASGRAVAAGAFVDGATWDAIGGDAAGDAALARCDAGAALAKLGALFVSGATGINHADVVIVG